MTEQCHKIPTGFLFTKKLSKGYLETVSIGDYGKAKNIKADFLGYTDEINGVENGPCMPMSEKWVVTLSTQYGCTMKCKFCDVHSIPFRGNASFDDLKTQLFDAIELFPDVNYTERLNIHFARMGEPIFNRNVFNFARWLYDEKRNLPIRIEVIHPVLTTSLPRAYGLLEDRILKWCDIKNNLYNGQAGLQFSINSTCEKQRSDMFNDMQLHLEDLCKITDKMPDPVGRKYCLNFALASHYEVDAKKLAELFNPDKFMVKITPIHNNTACRENGIETIDGYDSYLPYKKAEEDLKSHGFDVLIFVPSMDEEDGLVTCGNMVLGGSSSDMINPHNE